MPAKRTTSTTKRSQAAPKKANNRKFVIGIFAVVSLLFVGFFFYWISGGSMSTEQQKMETYLKDKYGQEFVVKNVRVTGSGLGVTGSIRGDAYPKNDPSLKFELRKPEDKNFYDYDSFLTELWSRQGREQVDKFIKRELPNVKTYTLRIAPGTELLNSIQGRTPSFSQIQNEQPGQFGYELGVVSLTSHATASPSDSELERAFKVASFVKEQSTAAGIIARYTYNIDGGGYARFEAENRSALDAINSPDDLKDKFKKLN